MFALDVSAGFSTPSEIEHFDFGKPVIDFVLEDDGSIWVCLDAQWGDAGDDVMVHRIKLVAGKVCIPQYVRSNQAHRRTVSTSSGGTGTSPPQSSQHNMFNPRCVPALFVDEATTSDPF